MKNLFTYGGEKIRTLERLLSVFIKLSNLVITTKNLTLYDRNLNERERLCYINSSDSVELVGCGSQYLKSLLLSGLNTDLQLGKPCVL